MIDAPLANTPVFNTDRFPRWLRRPSKLPARVGDLPHHRQLFDHMGATIIDGRRAFVSEPYARGCIDALSLATDLAIAADCELRVSLATWHGFGTMRFAWLAPRDEKSPKHLVQFVATYEAFAELAKILVESLPQPADCDRDTMLAKFWRPLWHIESGNRNFESVRIDLEAFLSWHGYQNVRRRAA